MILLFHMAAFYFSSGNYLSPYTFAFTVLWSFSQDLVRKISPLIKEDLWMYLRIDVRQEGQASIITILHIKWAKHVPSYDGDVGQGILSQRTTTSQLGNFKRWSIFLLIAVLFSTANTQSIFSKEKGPWILDYQWYFTMQPSHWWRLF